MPGRPPPTAAPRVTAAATPPARAAGRRWARATAVLVAVVGMAAPACAGPGAGGAPDGAAAAADAAPGSIAPDAPGSVPVGTSAPTTTTPAWTATSTTTPVAAPAGPCLATGGVGAAPPTTRPDLAAAASERLAPALEQLRGAGGAVGVSVWVDGVGQVAALEPTAPLVPASNQKLLVAFGALDLLPADATLSTTVVATGPVVGGVVQGDLVLVGGGDPTLTRSGPHSLDTLAAAVRDAGVTGATGNLLVDESRYDATRTGAGWVDGAWQQSNVGLLSAVVVDRNRGYADPAFAADPPLANLHAFREALTAAGVTLTGVDAAGSGRSGTQVAALASPPLAELVAALLGRSDNLAAELLVKELGWRARGDGSSAAGLEVARAAVAGRCVVLDGTDADGSGLSRADTRSPDAWRRLLDAARARPWFATFRDGLAVSGQAGTLATRLGGPETAGRVHAKTGSTAVSGALSGYLTSASGASVVFSIVVNQPHGAPEPAIDAFVTELVREL